MILVDANLLLYAENSQSPHHSAAPMVGGSAFWFIARLPLLERSLRVPASVHQQTGLQRPLTLEEAIDRVQSWLDQPCVRIVHPTQRHWDVFRDMLTAGKATANLVSDAHLAALAIEYGCELNSTDADFSRFPKLAWKNPLQ